LTTSLTARQLARKLLSLLHATENDVLELSLLRNGGLLLTKVESS
jgi:hypothetical protein